MIHVAVKPVESNILQSLELGMQELGFEIVRIQVQGSERPTLEIIIDRLDRENVSIDDCVAASNYASTVLDVVDPFDGKYTLQVFSPGFDRPLTKTDDFERFRGLGVKVKLNDFLNGRKRLVGFIEDANSEKLWLRLAEENELLEIAFADIFQAQLVSDLEKTKEHKGSKK